MKILVMTPDFEVDGGVTNFVQVFSKYCPLPLGFFHVGQRGHQENPIAKVVRTVRDLFSFWRRLRDEQWDFVHFNPSLDAKAFLRDVMFMLIARAVRVPYITLIHGWVHSFERVMRDFLLPLARPSLFQSKVIVVLGSEFEEKIRSMGFGGPLQTILPPVDDSLLGSYGEKQITEKYVSLGTPVLLFLARLHKSKGIYLLIDTAKELRNRGFQFELHIAGSGPEEEGCRLRLQDAGLVGSKMLGHVTGQQKAFVFASGSLYLLPTLDEGVPTSMLEAMAFGLPIITRPAGGIRALFQDTKMGFLTESLDANVYANLVVELLENKDRLKEIALYNHRFALANCLASNIARKLQSVYADAATIGN